jgi:hypothetical protein
VKYTQAIEKVNKTGSGKIFDRLLGNERGVALAFALVLLLVLTVMGTSATLTSEVDLKVSGNTKVIRSAFYVADGGIQLSPKVVSEIITDRALPTAADTPLITYDTDNLLAKVMGYLQTDNPANDTTDISMDRGAQGILAVDISRLGSEYLSGGGIEFAAGTEGVGISGTASTAIIYDLAGRGTVGSSPNTTVVEIVANYRKVAGVSGGR